MAPLLTSLPLSDSAPELDAAMAPVAVGPATSTTATHIGAAVHPGAGHPDAGPSDTGPSDAGPSDAGPSDAGPSEPPAENPERTRRRELAEWTRVRLRDGLEQGGSALHEAQAAVIEEHLWLARAVAHRYHYRGEDDDDLMQVASIGLVEAVNRFDPERGDFLAFAAPTISGVVKRHFRDHGWLVRPPRRTQELAGNIRRKWADLTQELGAEPTDRQLGEHLGEDLGDVVEARCASHGYRAVSMNKLSDDPRLKVVADRDLEDVEARMIIERLIDGLDDDDQRLLRMRFYEGRSQSDIAAEIGTNQMQVSRKLARLLTRLRQLLGTETSLLAS